MLALIRLTNAASLFLPVLPTPLRGYCCTVRQNERQLPCGSGETQGEGVSLHFYLTNLSGLTTRGFKEREHRVLLEHQAYQRGEEVLDAMHLMWDYAAT